MFWYILLKQCRYSGASFNIVHKIRAAQHSVINWLLELRDTIFTFFLPVKTWYFLSTLNLTILNPLVCDWTRNAITWGQRKTTKNTTYTDTLPRKTKMLWWVGMEFLFIMFFYLMTDKYAVLHRIVTVKPLWCSLRDLVSFKQFKKREKHPWRSVTFNKVAGFSNFLKLCKWYQIAKATHMADKEHDREPKTWIGFAKTQMTTFSFFFDFAARLQLLCCYCWLARSFARKKKCQLF